MKKNFCLFLMSYCFSFCYLLAAPPIESLPWVDGKDDEAHYYAVPYLSKEPVILEAGVCNGEDSLRFKKQWPKSIIYGFEAHPLHFLQAQAATKNIAGIYLYPLALCDRVGTTTFYCSELKGEASSILADNKKNVENIFNDPPEWLSYLDKPITVRCTTIDHWAREMNVVQIDYIWLDTEGAELQILSCATDFLHEVRVISTEVNFQEFRAGMTQFSQLYEFLTKQNFSLKYIWAHPKWQGVAMFVNNRFLAVPLNLSSPYLVPKPIKR